MIAPKGRRPRERTEQVDWISTPALLAIAGFAGGMVLGLAARLGRFCTLGAIEDAVLLGDRARLRAWGLAIAAAILAVHFADLAGIIELESAIYLSSSINVPAAVLGGLLFGVGMALAGTCGFGALSRIGGGDLKALVMVGVMAVSAYAAMNGITAVARSRLIEPLSFDIGRPQSIAGLVSEAIPGLPAPLVAVAIAGLILWWCFRDPDFRSNRRLILAGLAVGGAVSFGWLATGIIGADPFDPQRLESYTFARPLGDSLIYLMTFTGSTIRFGIGATFGVVAGSLAAAIVQRRIRWEACDDPRELRRQMLGAFFMGTGGVLALGCTIGQGVSAASVLAVSAPIVLASIYFGAWAGLTWLVGGVPTDLSQVPFLRIFRRPTEAGE